jgi:hypothetical protein
MNELQDARDLGVIEISFPDLYRAYVLALRQCRIPERQFIVATAEHAGNAYDAAASMGLPKFMADRFLARPRVAAAWRALDAIIVHRLGITTARILTEMVRLATSDIAKLFNEDGSLIPFSEMSADQSAAIESVEVEELFYGVGEARRQIGVIKKVKLHKKQPALNALARMRGMATEREPSRVPASAKPQLPGAQAPAALDLDALSEEQVRAIASIPVNHT